MHGGLTVTMLLEASSVDGKAFAPHDPDAPEASYAPRFFDNLHRPNDLPVRANFLKMVDPEGGAQDAYRFSTRQDAASKNPRYVADGRFASALESFLW